MPNQAAALTGLFALLLSACSSKDGGSGGNATPGTGSGGASTANGAGGDASPGGATAAGGGGSTAPDPCGRVESSLKPCSNDPDPCGLNSGFEGDEYCIKPPPEGQGIQIHFGPKDYKDAAEVAKYVMNPGEEFNAYGIADIPTTEVKWYNHVQIRMRPGSHHLINTVVSGKPAEGFVTGGGCDGTQTGSFPGTQNLVFDSPPGGVPAPENVGLGSSIPADSSLCLNYHTYNFTEVVKLREVWINVWFVDEKDVTQKALPVIVSAGPYQGIAPGTQAQLKRTATVTGDGRIVSLFGHRHVWTDRFAVWKNDELVYDSRHWDEAVVFGYDSITTNPPLDTTGDADGATSGILTVKDGDQVAIECDVNNTSTKTLTFKNALYDGEMCILFGSAVGATVRAIP